MYVIVNDIFLWCYWLNFEPREIWIVIEVKFNIYSGDGLLWTTLNINFGFLQIKWEPMIVKKQMIPHLNALIMDIKIPDKEGRGVIRGLPRPLFVKSVLFRKKGRGKSLMLPRPCSSRILLSTTIAKKWRIVGFCTTCSF